MLLSFFPYYPVILYITLLVENAKKKYVQYISSYFCYYFIFSRSRKRNIPVSKRVDVSRPSIYVCVCVPILVTTFPEWLSGTEPLPHTPGAVYVVLCVHVYNFAGLV